MGPGGDVTECPVLIPANYKISRLNCFFSLNICSWEEKQDGEGRGKVPVQSFLNFKKEDKDAKSNGPQGAG